MGKMNKIQKLVSGSIIASLEFSEKAISGKVDKTEAALVTAVCAIAIRHIEEAFGLTKAQIKNVSMESPFENDGDDGSNNESVYELSENTECLSLEPLFINYIRSKYES